MKKAFSFLMWVMIALSTLYPTGVLLTTSMGYTLKVFSVSAFAIILAAISVCIVILDLTHRGEPKTKTMRFFLAIITPFSLLTNAIFILDHAPVLAIASALISVGCCCYLAIKYGKPLLLKFIALILSATLALPICFFSFIAMVMGDFGQTTVTQTVESPSGKYYAQVIDSDQGALGGDTLVDVYEKNDINLLLFKIEKKPQRVYVGDWGEFQNMQLHWKDDSCLIINSVEYEIE